MSSPQFVKEGRHLSDVVLVARVISKVRPLLLVSSLVLNIQLINFYKGV